MLIDYNVHDRRGYVQIRVIEISLLLFQEFNFFSLTNDFVFYRSSTTSALCELYSEGIGFSQNWLMAPK
jgi:hypothetical protein